MKPMSKPVDALLGLPSREDDSVDSQFVTALARGLEVLRAFEPKEGPLGNSELAERSGLPKPTVSRITYTLTKLGYLEYLPRLGKYRIGLGVLALGHECVGGAALRRAARPFMQDFASYADASVALGGRDRLSMVYLDVSRGLQTASFSLDAGARIPMYRSAMGFAYLWAIPDKARNFLFEAMRKRLGEEWPKVKKQIAAAFKSLDRDGFCVAEGTYERAICGAGVALSLRDGAEVYAISCSAPAFQLSAQRLRDEIGPRLVALVTSVKNELEGHARHAY
jgi:DNA-binding IclR family transcriptional regulator